MNRLLPALAVGCMLMLAGCTAPFLPHVPNIVNAQKVSEIEASYGVLQAGAVGYAVTCKPGTPCYVKGAATQLKKANDAVMVAFANLDAYAAAHAGEATLQFTDLVGAAETAIATVKTIEAQYGISPK